jgi:hypothetical protein
MKNKAQGSSAAIDKTAFTPLRSDSGVRAPDLTRRVWTAQLDVGLNEGATQAVNVCPTVENLTVFQRPESVSLGTRFSTGTRRDGAAFSQLVFARRSSN